MKVHTRLVIDAEPEVKEMVNKIKHVTGKSIKEIVETLIRQQYQTLQLDKEMNLKNDHRRRTETIRTGASQNHGSK